MSTSNQDAGANSTANGTDGVAAITGALEATTIQELGRKVFIGNLSFATKDDQLREVFSKHGEISDVQIIHRGTRSLGYGFVTFVTCEEAQKAVAATDKAEIDGRAINVEIAKPAPGTPGGAVPRAAAKAAKASKARQTNSDAKGSDDDHDNATDHPSPTGSKARRSKSSSGRDRNRRQGRARRPAGEPKPEANGDDHGVVTDASTHNEEDSSSKPRSKRIRSRRGKAGPPSSGEPRRERRPRRKGPPEGEPSQTLLFVANLSFDVTDEILKEFFSSYKVASAHVVCRKFGSTVGRSKGFGFVEFEDEENQLKALEETQGKELDGRALSIKIAVNETKKADESAEKTDDASAPVLAEPAAA